MNFTVTPTTYELHPEGRFPAAISDIEDSEGIYGPQFKFILDTEHTPDIGYQLHHYTSQKFSDRSKLGKLIAAVSGETANSLAGQSVDVRDLVLDQAVVVRVEHQEKADGDKRAVITDILPPERPRTRPGGTKGYTPVVNNTNGDSFDNDDIPF